MKFRAFLTLCFAIFVITAFPANADEWKKTYKIDGTSELRLDAMDGNVRISGADANRVEARVTTVGWSISEDEVRVTERQTGDRVEIEVKVPRWQANWSGRRSIEIEIVVPRNSNLDVHTGDGNITAQSLVTPAAGQPSSGGSVRLDTGDGNITVDGAGGRISLRTGDGNISASELDGSLEAHTGDGNVVVRGRFDKLSLHTGDGNIEARVGQRSKIVSSWNIRTGDGSVTMRLPDGFGADLDAHTGDGSIRLDFPVTVSGKLEESTVRGRMNNGGGLLTIRSGDGSIRIERL
jgi:DUF4097 and DUF4098 domain-containing protein YvlB